MRESIKLAGQPSGAVAISVSFNPETDAAIQFQVENQDGQKLDLMLSALQAEALAGFLAEAEFKASWESVRSA